jgi:hypothetical protein
MDSTVLIDSDLGAAAVEAPDLMKSPLRERILEVDAFWRHEGPVHGLALVATKLLCSHSAYGLL